MPKEVPINFIERNDQPTPAQVEAGKRLFDSLINPLIERRIAEKKIQAERPGRKDTGIARGGCLSSNKEITGNGNSPLGNYQ